MRQEENKREEIERGEEVNEARERERERERERIEKRRERERERAFYDKSYIFPELPRVKTG